MPTQQGPSKTRQLNIEHKGRTFGIVPSMERTWVVTEMISRAPYGRLVLLDEDGEDGLPVYGGIPAGYTEPLHQGSDWDGIVRALINQTDWDVDT
ncbi:hypothetical protein [Paramicrobacterium agarici]|uniref:hypothetical protein n=1 Tax=Paramicrobacterium agarici TaxID=630514 RepID=UPI0011525911|nr:hypothetical protein [Microbacterium agarici]TQO22430.1 hypothetical protein FB385_1260 [Microbacterium agarici]